MVTRRQPQRLRKKTRLFNGPPSGTPRVKGTGYGTRKKALATLKKIRRRSRALQRQVATTMYYRAKYHKYQTQGMRNAMKVYKPFLNSFRGGELKVPPSPLLKIKSFSSRKPWVQRTRPAYPENWESRSYPLEADRL
jgi:hypothetical protein